MSRRVAVALLLVAALAGPAAACPVCDSPTAERVRAGAFGAGLPARAVAALSPLPVLFAAVALIHFGVPGLSCRRRPS